MARINSFLELAIKQKASDLHLISGEAPRIRLYGDLFPVKYRELTVDETEDLIFETMPGTAKNTFDREFGADYAYEVPNLSRFRVNAFRHINGVGAVFRAVPSEVPPLDELDMPPVLKTFCQQKKGLLLVVGPTGAGKSTTLAAMIDEINRTRKAHIITIEDPVEFIHKRQQSLLSQREVGSHTGTFAGALRSALREDPDVILVGELRDLETVSLAVTAAETGILIIATLHTGSAAATVDRMVNLFPGSEQPRIRSMLSTSLCGVVAQQLLRRADGKGRVAAIEVLVNNAAISNMIREGKTKQLGTAIQTGALVGMQGIDQALRRLLDAKLITGDAAYEKADNKAAFARLREEVELA
jgi:twitching motility protein PilT